MHQRRLHLSAHVRRTLLAVLVSAGAGPLAADEQRQASDDGSTAETSDQSLLELRLTHRPSLNSATGDTSAAEASRATEPATRPQPKTGQPQSPERTGLPQSPSQPTETAPAPLVSSDPTASEADGDGWVARGSTEADPAPAESSATDQPDATDQPSATARPSATEAPAAEEDRSAAPPLSLQLDAGRSRAEGRASTEAPATERLETVGSSSAAEEVQKRLETVIVRRLRVARDGSLLGQGELPERDSRGSHGPGAAPPPAGGRSEPDSEPESRGEREPARAVELDYTGRPAEPFELTAEVRRLEPTLRRCLQHYYAHPERANRRSNWGMLHSIMVYGVDTPILAGSQSYNAIAWIAGNNICRGKRLLRQGPSGIEAATGIGLQGHQAQLLAVFALVGVPADYPLYAGRSKYSVADLVQAEARACRSGEELTFSLIGLSHYLETDASWTGADGERWDFQRLIREELAQPIVGSACGGTHRLMGFAHALRERRREGRPVEGQWRRAEMYLEDFVDYTYQLQNRDGSMSTNWFEGRQDNGDRDRKVQTTGHMVEFLLTVTPDSQLQNPKLVNAVRYLVGAMDNDRDHDWSIGPKGHALRSLAMYYQRVYGEGTPWQAPSAAASRQSRRR